MASQGPLSAGAGADDAAVGTATWTNPGNIVASDNTRASGPAVFNSGAITHYLKSSSHGFSIPGGSTINGIIVEIEKSQGSAQQVRDSRVRIVKADGTVGTTDKADTATDWVVGAAETYTTYGSSSDLWGESWTAADINDADFGVVIAATNVSASNSTARVDHIRITVHYTAGGGTTHTASADIAGAGAVAGSATRSAIASASITGTGTVAATAVRIRLASAQIAGAGAVNAQGGVTRVGSVSISGTGTIAATAIYTAIGAGAISGTGTIWGEVATVSERWPGSTDSHWAADTDSRWVGV